MTWFLDISLLNLFFERHEEGSQKFECVKNLNKSKILNESNKVYPVICSPCDLLCLSKSCSTKCVKKSLLVIDPFIHSFIYFLQPFLWWKPLSSFAHQLFPFQLARPFGSTSYGMNSEGKEKIQFERIVKGRRMKSHSPSSSSSSSHVSSFAPPQLGLFHDFSSSPDSFLSLSL